MDEDEGGGFFLFGGAFSTLIGIGALILALNNPTISDLRAEAASLIQQEMVNSSNPFLALMSQEIGAAGADTLTIRSTNYIILTHFEVTTPDARFLGGDAPQQLCFVGVMKKFYPCDQWTSGVSQSTSAGSVSSPGLNDSQATADSTFDERDAARSDSRRSLSPRDMELMGLFSDVSLDPSNPDLLRPKGWSCDGVRVKFAPDTPWSTIGVEIAGQSSVWSMSIGTQGVVTVSDPENVRFAGASFLFEPSILYFNDRVCVAVK